MGNDLLIFDRLNIRGADSNSLLRLDDLAKCQEPNLKNQMPRTKREGILEFASWNLLHPQP